MFACYLWTAVLSSLLKTGVVRNQQYLEWLSIASSLDVIEKLLRLIVHRINYNSKQFQNIKDLEVAVRDDWQSLNGSYIRNIYHTIQKHLLAAIDKNGRATKFWDRFKNFIPNKISPFFFSR